MSTLVKAVIMTATKYNSVGSHHKPNQLIDVELRLGVLASRASLFINKQAHDVGNSQALFCTAIIIDRTFMERPERVNLGQLPPPLEFENDDTICRFHAKCPPSGKISVGTQASIRRQLDSVASYTNRCLTRSRNTRAQNI